MILKIVGAIWMIGPFIIFATSDNVTGELAFGGVASFFMGLAAFTYESKEEKEFKKATPIPPKIIRKPKAKIETFVSDTYLIQKDPVRYMTGSPGEVSRVLSENYYRLFCNESKTRENALKFLEYRANSFNAIAGTDLNKDSLKAISNKYYNKVSTLIFFLCYHENYFGENNIFRNDYVSEVYKIVIEEHNKMCPEGQEEVNEFTIELFYDIKEIYAKYNSIAESTNDKNAVECIIDFEDDDDDDDNASNFSIRMKETLRPQLTQRMFDLAVEECNNILKRGNKLGEMELALVIKNKSNMFKEDLIEKKDEICMIKKDINDLLDEISVTVTNRIIDFTKNKKI